MDMLEQVLSYLHNWFPVGVYHGEYAVKDGALDLPFLQDGQYFRVMGSVWSDGLHRWGPDLRSAYESLDCEFCRRSRPTVG